jgi:hypothetical protein
MYDFVRIINLDCKYPCQKVPNPMIHLRNPGSISKRPPIAHLMKGSNGESNGPRKPGGSLPSLRISVRRGE